MPISVLGRNKATALHLHWYAASTAQPPRSSACAIQLLQEVAYAKLAYSGGRSHRTQSFCITIFSVLDTAMATMVQVDGETDHHDFLAASFRYFNWQDIYLTEKPYEILFDIPQDAQDPRRCNFSFSDSSIKESVKSVRGRESDFDLDIHGFAFRTHQTQFTAWDDRDAIRKQYVPEMEAFIKTQFPEATKVVAYDWRVSYALLDFKSPYCY